MQIADDLRRKISEGELGPGDRLPSARELMQVYDVSNTAAQSALRTLRMEGLTDSVQGRGTFVKSDGSARNRASVEPTAVNQVPDVSPQVRDLASAVSRIQEELEAQTPGSDWRQEIDGLQAQIDGLQAQIIELCGRLGVPVPSIDVHSAGGTRRTASG